MILYSNLNNHKTYAEFWGASTKHPDCIECLQDDIESKRFSLFNTEYGITVADLLQWLLYLSSKKTWIFHATSLAKEVVEFYDYIDEADVEFSFYG